jgi:hypothetical protein
MIAPRMALTRYLDVVLVVIGGAVAVVLGAPALGCALGAGAWILQRILAAVDKRWVGKLREPRQRLGASLFEGFARIWLLAIAIIVAGVAGGRADGLAAAVVILFAYSVAFVIRLGSGPPSPRTGPSSSSNSPAGRPTDPSDRGSER